MIRQFLRISFYFMFVAPTLLLVDYLYIHRQEPVGALSSRFPLLGLALGVAIFCWSYRTKVLDAIDCHFSGAAYGRRVEEDFLRRASRPPKIQAPPGIHLRSFARLVFSTKSFELVIEPTLRDLFDEYCEALNDDPPNLKKAQLARLRGYLSFWSAVLAQIPVSFTKLVVTVWKGIQ